MRYMNRVEPQRAVSVPQPAVAISYRQMPPTEVDVVDIVQEDLEVIQFLCGESCSVEIYKDW